MEKIVWIAAFIRVSSKLETPVSKNFSFSTLSQAELERITTAPHIFISRIRRAVDERRTSVNSAVTRHLIRSPLIEPRQFHRLKLVGGGRFLVTSTEDGLLELWDLGYLPSALLPLHPVASTAVTGIGSFDDCLHVNPRGDGSGFIILFISSSRMTHKFTVFAIEPTVPAPKFELIATRETSAFPIGPFSLSNFVVGWIERGREVHFWDARQDLHLQEASRCCFPDMTTPVGNQLLIIESYKRRVHIHRIPTFSSRRRGGRNSLVPQEGRPSSAFTQTHDLSTTIVNSINDAVILKDSDRLYLGLFAGDQSLCRFSLQPFDSSASGSNGWRLIPTLFGKSFLKNNTRANSRIVHQARSSLTLSDHEALLVWKDFRGGMYAALQTTRPGYLTSDTSAVQLSKVLQGEEYESRFDRSPLLGRLVHLSPHGVLQVLDFVPPPAS
ncbi:hypothetical protein JAAARDRAFT_200947 [Jaapia argillacea MUCL 33604]|uniref:F-box domain-containing protein n=1 Tax=Jaapia argillacea MUCL 33604 TaxID=933084 RepID=A0A067PFQ7_9AGAM|nr:hypothetical protein JAAARDRAFT_200947 [Jaapia argillacea MUCL 33604]